jgi:hypothetical protein
MDMEVVRDENDRDAEGDENDGDDEDDDDDDDEEESEDDEEEGMAVDDGAEGAGNQEGWAQGYDGNLEHNHRMQNGETSDRGIQLPLITLAVVWSNVLLVCDACAVTSLLGDWRGMRGESSNACRTITDAALQEGP